MLKVLNLLPKRLGRTGKPIKDKKAITVTRRVAVALKIAFQLSVRKMTHNSKTPKQPKAADSEGCNAVHDQITPMS